ncbi:hypothetical protein U1Q18_028786, partial [Sarracenia purpurea var. burkii]
TTVYSAPFAPSLISAAQRLLISAAATRVGSHVTSARRSSRAIRRTLSPSIALLALSLPIAPSCFLLRSCAPTPAVAHLCCASQPCASHWSHPCALAATPACRRCSSISTVDRRRLQPQAPPSSPACRRLLPLLAAVAFSPKYRRLRLLCLSRLCLHHLCFACLPSPTQTRWLLPQQTPI